MDDSRSGRILAADERHHWQIRAGGHGAMEIDLHRACLILSDVDLRMLVGLMNAASQMHGVSGLLAQATNHRLVYRCPHTDVWTLLFDRVVLRFRRSEFLTLGALCRAAVDALGPPAIHALPRSMASGPFSPN